MNQHINALLGPLEAATRSGNWEDAEDIAGEIRRLARLIRLHELGKIQEALRASKSGKTRSAFLKHPPIAPRGSQVAKAALPVLGSVPIRQGESILIQSAVSSPACPEPFVSEQWPFG